MPNYVKVIIVLSGKRKSGKDYVANAIVENLAQKNCFIMRVASPIKKHFCQKYKMNYDEMMTSSQYKEQRREEMIKWGEEQRNRDASIFCCVVKEEALVSQKPVWILSDARRVSDVDYFKKFASSNSAKFFSVRVSASIKTREDRGWKFTSDVDDVESECGLDFYNNWDICFENSSGDNVIKKINEFTQSISECIDIAPESI